jgi:integrase
MSRRRDERPRILGPYWIEKEGRCRVTTVDPGADGGRGRRTVRYFGDLEEAEKWRRVNEARFARLEGMTVESAVDTYRKHLERKGTSSVSYNETTRRLRIFFPDLGMQLARVTSEHARTYYEAFRARTKSNGEMISVDYHRCALINARSLFTWATEEGLVSGNPFAKVKGVGRRNAGKTQHTGDEVRRLYAHVLERAEGGDRAALGILMALLMALRSGDITRRVVRDVDLDATVLRVSDGKTKKSNRPRRVPEVLRGMLRDLATGRDPFEPLFRTPYTASGHHTRRWLEEAMVKLCAGAGVPYVCPHALKGTAGTLLAETGEMADKIADHLSHERVSTTERHYVAAGAMAEAQTARALKVITGGRGR